VHQLLEKIVLRPERVQRTPDNVMLIELEHLASQFELTLWHYMNDE